MDRIEKQELLKKAEVFFQEIIDGHYKNIVKLKSLKVFDINPFIWHYISNCLEGDSDPKSLAKALIYPRVLGTSITTSFGTKMQQFITTLGAYGSTTQGIDIEFTGSDGKKKYCQLKSGPNALNRDDVKTIADHFKGVRNLAKTNNLDVGLNDMLFCVLYGEPERKNTFIKELEKDYRVLVGNEFWTEFTGDPEFYDELIKKFSFLAQKVNMKSTVDEIVNQLAEEIQKKI